MCASEWLLFLSEPLRWVSSPNTNLERQTFFISRQTFFVSRRLSPANVSDLSVRRALNTCGAVTRDRRKWYGCCCYGCWRELWLVIHRRLLHFGEVSFFITFLFFFFFIISDLFIWFIIMLIWYQYVFVLLFIHRFITNFVYQSILLLLFLYRHHDHCDFIVIVWYM